MVLAVLASVMCLPVLGQTLLVSPSAGAPGETITVEISWAGAAVDPPGSLQWETLFPSQLLEADLAGPETGPAVKDSGKVLACTSRKSYSYSCVVAGGRAPLPSGPVAIFHFKIKNDARPGSFIIRVVKVEAATPGLDKLTIAEAAGPLTVGAAPGSPQPSAGTPRAPAGTPQAADAVGAAGTESKDTPAGSSPDVVLRHYRQALDDLFDAVRLNLEYEAARDKAAKARASLPPVSPADPPAFAQNPKPQNPKPANSKPEAPKPERKPNAASIPAPLAVPSPAPAVADSKSAAEHNQRGRELTQQHKYNEALEELNQAVRLKPDWPLAYNSRGFNYFMLRNSSSALKDFDEAIRLNPTYRNAYHNRAAARKAAGDAKGAAEDLAQEGALAK